MLLKAVFFFIFNRGFKVFLVFLENYKLQNNLIMKKITYLLLLLFTCFSYGQTCIQYFENEGYDDDPTILTVNASDLTCAAGTVNSITITDAILDDLFAWFFGETYCLEYYSFELNIDGVVTSVCADELIGMDVSGFTTLTITSADIDDYSDSVYMYLEFEVDYTATAPPVCATITAPLTNSEDALEGYLEWEEVPGAAGYSISLGTTTGGTDILNSYDAGDETDYDVPGSLTGGITYFLNVTPYNDLGDATGCTEYTFEVPSSPANDNFADATLIACGATFAGSTLLATLDEDNAPDGGGADLDARNVWFKYIGTGTPQTVKLSLCGSDYDTSVLVYTGTSGNLTFVAANDDAGTSGCPDAGTRSLVSFTSDGTSTYYITVEGYNESSYGAFSMDVSCTTVTPPASTNQTCAQALAVDVNDTPVTSDNSFGTVNPTQPSCDSFGSIQDVWFSFVAPTSGTVTITITNVTMTSSNYNVYSGTCGSLTSLAVCTTDSATGGNRALTGLVAGDTYYVQVWSNASEQGTFTINLRDTSLSTSSFDIASLKAYPNPVKEVLNLSYYKDITSVSVFNLLGQQVIAKFFNNANAQVDMSSLSKGTYLAKINADNQVKTIKVVKE